MGAEDDGAAGAVRAQLARELHDGVVQLLAHLRLELDFLARHGGDDAGELRREAARLADVAAGGLDDVRSLVQRLRGGEGRA